MNREWVAELIRVRPAPQVSKRIDLLVLEQVGAQATSEAWDQVWDGVRWPIWRETKAQVCHRVVGQAQEVLLSIDRKVPLLQPPIRPTAEER